MEDVPTIVIDFGSYLTKAGYSKDESPTTIVRTVVGRSPRDQNLIPCQDRVDIKGVYKNEYPIINGVITNWKDMEQIIEHIFRKRIKISSYHSDYNIIFSESINNTKQNHEKMQELMFETYSFSTFYVGNQNVFSLYSTGRITGISCDISYGVTSIVPIYEGYSIQNTFKCINYGGKDITDYLQKSIEDQLNYVSIPYYTTLANNIKENYEYVALDFQSELKNMESIKIPFDKCDEIHITESFQLNLSNYILKCTENLFKIAEIDKNIIKSINNINVDFRNNFYDNIVLSGGSSMIKGLPERLEKEIIELAPKTATAKVVALPERKYAAWLGGSAFSKLPIFPQCVITRDEFDEVGPNIVHRKCLS